MLNIILDISPFIGSSDDTLMRWFAEQPKTPALRDRILAAVASHAAPINWMDFLRAASLEDAVYMVETIIDDTEIQAKQQESVIALLTRLIQLGVVSVDRAYDAGHLGYLICTNRFGPANTRHPVIPSNDHINMLVRGAGGRTFDGLMREVCRLSMGPGSLSVQWALEIVRQRRVVSHAQAANMIETFSTVKFASAFLDEYARNATVNPFTIDTFYIHTNNFDRVSTIIIYYIAMMYKSDITVGVQPRHNAVVYTFTYDNNKTCRVEDMIPVSLHTRFVDGATITHAEIAAAEKDVLFAHYTYLDLIPPMSISTAETQLMRRARFHPFLRAQLPNSLANYLEYIICLSFRILNRDITQPYLPLEMRNTIMSFVILDRRFFVPSLSHA